MQIRQGDVFLRQVEQVPPTARRVDHPMPQVLAYGEVTGHRHQVLEAVVTHYIDHDGRAYILLDRAGVLSHEEHEQVTLLPGPYEIIIERDYDPSIYQRRVVD